jgi:acetyl esterase
MPDDPAIDAEILAARASQAQASGAPFDITTLPPDEGRRRVDAGAMFFNDGRPELARVEDFEIAGPGGALRLRLYQPPAPRRAGGVFYIHGGGWYACSVDTHDRMLRSLALVSRATVVGIDYRLSPEHAYPAALEDCQTGWDWLRAQAAAFGFDGSRIVLAGDSGGANLALALAIRLRDAGRTPPTGLALLYGCFAPIFDTESHRRFGSGRFGLTTARMRWYWNNYLGAASEAPPALATPLRADLAGLPPAYVGVAEADVVTDDSLRLVERMREAGGAAELRMWSGAVHGFLQMTRDAAIARRAVDDIAQAIGPWLDQVETATLAIR